MATYRFASKPAKGNKTVKRREPRTSRELEEIKELINSGTYMQGAIERLAQILSSGFVERTERGLNDERKLEGAGR